MMDTSMNILCSEYDVLKSKVTTLENDLESKNQLIYDFKKKIELATALEGDYLQEIEILQSNDIAEVSELQRKVKELEDGIISFRHSSTQELLQKTELIERLQSEVKEVLKNASKDECKKRESDLINKEAERNTSLKEEVTIFTNTLLELQTSIVNLQMQNVNLEETKNNFLMELDHVKQNYTCKMQELAETKNLIHKLQEDSFIIKLELESAKNKPLDAAKKGNSLFAEVEDSRIKTQQNIQQLKKKYAELKHDVCNKLKQMTAMRSRNTELSDKLDFIKSCDEGYETLVETYKIKIAVLESAIEEYNKEVLKEQKFTGTDLPSYSVEFANDALRTKWNDGEKARNELNSVSKKKLETFINIKTANTEMREWRRKAQQLKIKIEKLENNILEIELQSSPTSLQSLEDFPQKMRSNSVSNCSESKPTLTIEDILKRNTVEIRKKKNNVDDKCKIKHEKQYKSLALDSELKIEMLRYKSLDLEAQSTQTKMQSEPTLHYPKDTEKKNNTEDKNNISDQVKQSEMLILDHITGSEILKSTLIESKIELIQPKMLELNIKDDIVETRNESDIEHQDNHDKPVIIVENISQIQLLKPTSHNISAEPAVQNMSLSRSLKMESDRDEHSKMLILDNITGSEILKSTTFDAKIELIEPKMLESNIKDDIVETRNESDIEHQDNHDKPVIIVENISQIQLLKPKSHNISAESAVQNMSLSRSLKMEFDHDEHSKMLILDNITGSEILNSTSFEAKMELIELKTDGNIKDDVETRNESNINQSVIECQDGDESVIIIENLSGIHLLESTSSSLKKQLNIEEQICKPTLVKEEVMSHLKNTVESSSNNHNNFRILTITDDQKQSNQNYKMESIKSIEFNNYVPQKTTSVNNWMNEIVSEPIKESHNKENFFHDKEFKKSTYEKSCVSNAGHTPAARQKFRSKSSSDFVELNKEMPQSNINNAGHTPATHQKWSLKNSPAGESSAKRTVRSEKKTLKTNIPIPTRRKLN